APPRPPPTARRTAVPTGAVPAAAPCSPRPNVGVSATPAGAGRLQVTVTATSNAGTPNNSLVALRFGAATNALIDVPGGQTGATGNFSRTPPPGTTQTTFVVRRASEGAAATVNLVVVDRCGDWQTVVGGGTSGF